MQQRCLPCVSTNTLGWSLHGRDAAAVHLMGWLLQCIQCGSSHQADASHGGNLLARKRCFCWHQAHKQAAWPTPRGQPARERSGRARASCADMRYPPPARGALHALRVACLNFRTSNAETWEVNLHRFQQDHGLLTIRLGVGEQQSS